MFTDLHPTVTRIRRILDQGGIVYKYFEHEAVRTSEEANALRPDYKLSQGVKALIVRYKKDDGGYAFAMLCIPGDQKFNGKRAAAILDTKSVTFATQAESDKLTSGIQFGGVPPFGNLFGIPVYVDPAVLQNQEIIFNCGDRRATIAMMSADWQRIVQPIMVELL